MHTAAPTDGQVLKWVNANSRWEPATDAGGMANIVEDTTPQLGGNLDGNGKDITSVQRLEIGTGAHTGSTLDIKNGGGTYGVQKIYQLYALTTNNTQTEIFIGAQGTTRMEVPSGNVWMFEIDVVAINDATSSNEQAGWKYTGMLHNVAGTTALTSNIGEIEIDPQTNWSVAVEADNTNDALVIKVTGENSKTIKWTAFAKTTQLG